MDAARIKSITLARRLDVCLYMSTVDIAIGNIRQSFQQIGKRISRILAMVNDKMLSPSEDIFT
jgi:hypothetical protein